MRAIERRLRSRLRDAQAQVERQRDEILKLEQDRHLFRDHFSRRFKWWIELLGQNKTPNLQWLIEQDAKELRSFQWWGW